MQKFFVWIAFLSAIFFNTVSTDAHTDAHSGEQEEWNPPLARAYNYMDSASLR